MPSTSDSRPARFPTSPLVVSPARFVTHSTASIHHVMASCWMSVLERVAAVAPTRGGTGTVRGWEAVREILGLVPMYRAWGAQHCF